MQVPSYSIFPLPLRHIAMENAQLILDPVPTPKWTPLLSPSGQFPPSRANNGPMPDLPESNDKDDGAETTGLPPNDLDQENGGDGAYVQGTVVALRKEQIARYLYKEQDI